MGDVIRDRFVHTEKPRPPAIPDQVKAERLVMRDAFFGNGTMYLFTPFGFAEVKIPPTDYRHGNYRRY